MEYNRRRKKVWNAGGYLNDFTDYYTNKKLIKKSHGGRLDYRMLHPN